jgi:hypothetical protein
MQKIKKYPRKMIARKKCRFLATAVEITSLAAVRRGAPAVRLRSADHPQTADNF